MHTYDTPNSQCMKYVLLVVRTSRNVIRLICSAQVYRSWYYICFAGDTLYYECEPNRIRIDFTNIQRRNEHLFRTRNSTVCCIFDLPNFCSMLRIQCSVILLRMTVIVNVIQVKEVSIKVRFYDWFFSCRPLPSPFLYDILWVSTHATTSIDN